MPEIKKELVTKWKCPFHKTIQSLEENCLKCNRGLEYHADKMEEDRLDELFVQEEKIIEEKPVNL